jgi:hypothetical protein
MAAASVSAWIFSRFFQHELCYIASNFATLEAQKWHRALLTARAVEGYRRKMVLNFSRTYGLFLFVRMIL